MYYNRLSGIETAIIENTWKNVNWNAKNSKGEFVCRKSPCYSKSYVEKIINKYTELLKSGKIAIYHPDSKTRSNDISTVASALYLQLEKGKVASILWEYYWVTNPAKTQAEIDKQNNPSNDDSPSASFFDYKAIVGGFIIGGGIAYLTSKKKKRR
jgi:hypothetical protein